MRKYHCTPCGTNKVLSLFKCSQLIKPHAQKVHYMKDRKCNLYISKAFASVLHHTGFEFEAKQVSKQFDERKLCFHEHDLNLKLIHKCEQEVRLRWFQCSSKHVKEL